MNLKQQVHFLKYESDLNNFFNTIARYSSQNQKFPSPSEVVKIKVALAVKIEGQSPQSSDPIYLIAYHNQFNPTIVLPLASITHH
jgi:hypothetical protein